jgi:outer membrane protein OmpA-like peptidoglycan-associated protein
VNKFLRMKRIVILLVVLILGVGTTSTFGQNEKKALANAEKLLGYDEYKAAIPYLKEAVGYNPNNSMSQFLLGRCLFLNYEKKEALPHFEKAYGLNKDVDPELSYYYAKSLHYTLKFDEAIVQYTRGMTKIPNKEPRYGEMAREIEHCKYAKIMVAKPVKAKIVNVGPPVNTQYSEHSPVIDADETVLIYTTVRPDNVGCKGDPACTLEDVYIADRAGKGWGNPRPIKEMNTTAMDASIALSPDGQEVFIYRNPPAGGDIFESHLEGKKWTDPKSVGEPVNSKNYETTVSISPDGKRMFFTSDREGGYGDTDIYMSEMVEVTDGVAKWGTPKNLGPKINTPFADDSPFFHPDGVTLYYSSNGRTECLGGYDIYETRLQPDGSWSDPVNLGYPINTPDNDIYFVLSADKKDGYYASAKEGGYGEKDIYKIEMPEEEPAVVVKEDTVKPVVVVNALTILKGVVTDAKTGEPLEGSITVIDNDKNQVVSKLNSNSASGRYLVSLPSGRNYGITVEREGYLFKSLNVNIPKSEGFQEIIQDVALDKIEIGVGIVLNNIFYDVDKATLRPESVAELERLHKLMVENPTLKIEIGGHTDSDGTDEHNQVLSQNRSQSVVDYLTKKGVKMERMVAKGYGEKTPVAPNDTKENKQLNRRTELKILEN